jgi:hypothetical protein
MKVRDLLKGKFVAAEDLEAGPLEVTIERWSVERLPHGEKSVVWFREGAGKEERGLVLNKTNLRRLEEILGSDDLDDWRGQRVVLFRDDTVIGPSGRQGGVRCRPVADGSGRSRSPEERK